jgi:hypothetical protein
LGCKITEQEKGRDGKAGVEDPGELERGGVWSHKEKTSEDKMESAEMESVVTR